MNTETAKDGEEDVVWKGTKAYEKRVSSFRVKPQEAYELAWKKREQLKYSIYFREPEFIVGQRYWFGQATKTEISLAGYYVNGINGQVEYRQSEKTIKAGAKHLPRDTWQKNSDSDYYFTMEETRQRELLERVPELKLGDSRGEVIKRLGPPTHDHKLYTKEKGEFRGRTLMYYLKMWEKDLANEKHDRFVMLQFDTGDRLTKIIQKVEDFH